MFKSIRCPERRCILFSSHLLVAADVLDGERHFAAERLDDGDEEVLAVIKFFFDLGVEGPGGVRVVAVQVFADLALVVHQVNETVVNDVDNVVLGSGDVGDFHVMGGWRHIFVFLAIEDVNSGKIDLSVTVLTSLRGGHINNFAGFALEHSITVLSKS